MLSGDTKNLISPLTFIIFFDNNIPFLSSLFHLLIDLLTRYPSSTTRTLSPPPALWQMGVDHLFSVLDESHILSQELSWTPPVSCRCNNQTAFSFTIFFVIGSWISFSQWATIVALAGLDVVWVKNTLLPFIKVKTFLGANLATAACPAHESFLWYLPHSIITNAV